MRMLLRAATFAAILQAALAQSITDQFDTALCPFSAFAARAQAVNGNSGAFPPAPCLPSRSGIMPRARGRPT